MTSSSPHPASPQALREELQNRLATVTDPAYADPAHHDLKAADYLLLVALNVSIVATMLWIAWG